MIINAKTIKEERIRAKHNSLTMSCVCNGVTFTRRASELINAPCMISFEKRENIFVAFHDNKDGFVVNSQNPNMFQINSRPLKFLLEKIFNKKKARFNIRPTTEIGIFALTLLEDETE